MKYWVALLSWFPAFGALAADVPFTSVPDIYDPPTGGPSSVATADLDGDGDLDLLGTNPVTDEVLWIENTNGDATAWVAHSVTTNADAARAVYAGDLDGDGDPDLLSASLIDDKIAWYENDGTPGGLGDWTERTISAAADAPVSVYAADIDLDGDLDVLSASQLDDKIAWYENQGGSPPSFVQHVITEDPDAPGSGAEGFANGATCVRVGDLDGDGDPDVVSASLVDDKIAWYENDGTPGGLGDWAARTVVTTADSARAVEVADVDGDGDLDLLSASKDDDEIAWYENQGGAPPVFAAHIITQDPDAPGSGAEGDVEDPVDVVAVDLDHDGDLDVVSAAIGTAPASRVTWYENDGTPGGLGDWTLRTISSAAPTDAVVAADLDGDGDLEPITSNSESWRWFENATIHRSAHFPAESIVSTGKDYHYALLEDVDRDGDLDQIVTVYAEGEIVWLENTLGDASVWTEHVLSSGESGPFLARSADLDGDGDPDVVCGHHGSDQVAWYENDGTPAAGAWTRRIVYSSAIDADPNDLRAVDVDVDGDLDLVVALLGSDELIWLENDDGDPTNDVGTWGQYDIASGLLSAYGVAVGDVDDDGRPDVVAGEAADAVSGDDVRLYSYGATPKGAWVSTLIDDTFRSARLLELGDLDGDGDLDLVVPYDGSDRIVWYANDGSWTAGTLSTTTVTPHGVTLVDLDHDGDLDVPFAAPDFGWLENDGTATSWTTRSAIGAASIPLLVQAGDVDGDGDPDLVTAGPVSDRTFWNENRGGQFALPTTDVAHLGMLESRKREVIEIRALHLGRSGDHDAEVVSLELQFLDGSGTPLDSGQAAALMSAFDLHVDDGDGVFEDHPADLRLFNLTSFDLVGGVETLVFDDFDPNAQFSPPPGDKRYFGVATLSATASSATPSAFRVVHLSESSSTAEDRDADLPLSFEFQADTGTAVIQALAPGSDFDLDGLDNEDEVDLHGTDPGRADTDGDALSDFDEVNTYPTDPLDPDSDDDGLDDGDEIALVFDPNDPDTDDDGYCDGANDPGGGACPAGVSDNCPATSNPGQTNSDAFTAGDACQCGNVDGLGGITWSDRERAREYLVGRTLGGAFDSDHCDVDADAACTVADLYLIERALAVGDADLQDACAAYKGPYVP